jgi:hypothetical protein
MSALAEAAVSQGARTGLLIASEEGQRLYSSLGWRHEADVLIARGPVIPPDAPAVERDTTGSDPLNCPT